MHPDNRWNPLGVRMINAVFDVFFFFDLIVAFRTGIVERRKENDERYVNFVTSNVMKRYLGGWFCLDLVATLPWKDMYTLAACDGFDMGLTSWQWRSLELVRLIRIFRYSRMKKTISQWEDIMQVG